MKLKKVLGLCLLIASVNGQIEHVQDPDAWRSKVFEYIYKTNHWKDAESMSGPGSSLSSTSVLRSVLPSVLKALDVHSLIDAGCGDFNWMKTLEVPLDFYLGVDIVGSLIDSNNEQYATINRCFLKIDIVRDYLPKVDAIFCRDCLIHLSYADIAQAIKNFKVSGATYLIATHFPFMPSNNIDIRTGDFHPINLCAAPFNFPQPIMAFQEISAEPAMRKIAKTMAVWRLEDIQY